MRKHFAYCLLFLLSSGSLIAQKNDAAGESEGEKTNYFGYGVTTNTHSGLLGGLVFRMSTPVSNGKTNLPIHRYIAVELVNIKHQKEHASPTPIGAKFIFGKTNYLFSVRPEYGREWYLFKKTGESSIGLTGILAAGPSLGIQKPYYIKYGGRNREQPILVQYNPDVHTDIGSITGAASIWQGFFNNAKVIPGFHVKAATSIDMSTFGDNITGIELGTTLEVFTRSPEIMSSKIISNPSSFATAYLTLYFGNKRRSNKK
jgi:hypothetical protein